MAVTGVNECVDYVRPGLNGNQDLKEDRRGEWEGLRSEEGEEDGWMEFLLFRLTLEGVKIINLAI